MLVLIKISTIVVIVCLLAGCGAKGDLYLSNAANKVNPEEKTSTQESTQPQQADTSKQLPQAKPEQKELEQSEQSSSDNLNQLYRERPLK